MLCGAMTAPAAHRQAPPRPDQSVAPDSKIHGILVDRIDRVRQSVGIVVGVIGPEGRRVIAYGHRDQGDPRPLNCDTIFEIGSVTKVFTALLLTDMVQRGEVKLDDPVAKYLPQDVKMPECDGRSITLKTLANHTSGLPRLPANLDPKDPANPYTDYTVDQLIQFLSGYKLTRDVGAQYEYSNVGAGLLGVALARRAGTGYEALVRSRICEPLGMDSTSITLAPEMRARLAAGHTATLSPAPNWDIPTLAGAGALRSSANDLLTFLAASLGYAKSSPAPAMSALLKVSRPTGVRGLRIALGWHVWRRRAAEIVWHNGGTGGYRSFIGFRSDTRVGVVVLSNAFTGIGVDDIAIHLLDPRNPLAKIEPPKEHKEIPVDPALFDGYEGRYQLTPALTLAVTREGDRLYAQATGQPRVELFPESERVYFLKDVDAQVTFDAGPEGKPSQLILHQAGHELTARRIE